MSRLLMLIAVLFAFASVGGASASYAHGRLASHGIFGTIADTSDECVAAQTVPKIAAYKPCTKKLNGIAIPCPHQPSVLPVAFAVCAMPELRAERLLPVAIEFGDGPEAERQFRPPRA